MKIALENTEAPSKTRADSARVETGFKNLGTEETKKTFEELDTILYSLAEQVVYTLDQMVPHLSQMQSLLSQRGIARKKALQLAGLPSWQEYAKRYGENLGCSFRTIQDHLTGFRRNGKSGASCHSTPKQQNNPPRLDGRQQSTLIKAQVVMNDVVMALENGGDWETPLSEYKKVAVTPEKLDTLLNSLNTQPDVVEATSIELLQANEKVTPLLTPLQLPAPAATSREFDSAEATASFRGFLYSGPFGR